MPSLLTSALVSRYSKLMMTSDHQLALITLVLEVNNWHFCPAPPTDQFLGDPTCSDQCRQWQLTWRCGHQCTVDQMTWVVNSCQWQTSSPTRLTIVSLCLCVMYWEAAIQRLVSLSAWFPLSHVWLLGRMLGAAGHRPAHSPPLGIRMPTLALSSAHAVDARTSSGSHFFQGFYPSQSPSYWTI